MPCLTLTATSPKPDCLFPCRAVDHSTPSTVQPASVNKDWRFNRLSYDRLFHAQDFMPRGGSFGNLIALPLQGACSARGTTVFLDPASLKPFDDQWAFLSTVEPLSLEAVADIANTFGDLAAGPDAAAYRRPLDPSAAPKPPARVLREGEDAFLDGEHPPGSSVPTKKPWTSCSYLRVSGTRRRGWSPRREAS